MTSETVRVVVVFMGFSFWVALAVCPQPTRLIASTQYGGREKAPHPPTREGEQVGRMSSPAGIAVSVRALATAPLRGGRVAVRGRVQRAQGHQPSPARRFGSRSAGTSLLAASSVGPPVPSTAPARPIHSAASDSAITPYATSRGTAATAMP